MKPYILVFFCLLSVSLLAQEGFDTKTVSIFKNGNAFFIKNGTVQPKDNKHSIDLTEIPRAAYGTFWMSNDYLKHLTSYHKEIETPRTFKSQNLPKSNADFLKDNTGKNATLYLAGSQSYTGKIVGVTNALVVLEVEGQWMSLPHTIVEYVILKSKPTGIEVVSKKDTLRKKKSIVELEFTNNQKQNIDLVYFRGGLGWIPSYKIELTSDKKAKISMQAAVSNDAEDLKNVDINFVVGYPNIKYGSSPIIFYSGGFQNIINQLNSNSNNFVQFNDRALRGGAYEYDDFSGISSSSVSVNGGSSQVPNLKSDAEEDLYFYNLKNVTLPKGGRAYYAVFEEEVEYEHVYDVSLTANHNNYYNYQQVSFDDPYRNKVWHTINLKNNTKHAWTSGAAMVLKNDGKTLRPISQDDLPYTSIGHENGLKLTLAPDVSVRDKEEEANRVMRQKQSDSYFYDIVTVKGEVKLHNFKNKKIELKVNKTIVGILKTSQPEWQTLKRVNIANPYNKTNNVCWEVTLKPGEKLTIEYEYQVYVRR